MLNATRNGTVGLQWMDPGGLSPVQFILGVFWVCPQKVAKGTIVTTGSDVIVALCSSGHERQQKEQMTACGAVQSEICAASHTWAALVKTACGTSAVHCKQPIGKEAEGHEEGVVRNVNKPARLSLCSVARQPYIGQDSNLGCFHPQHQTQHILL